MSTLRAMAQSCRQIGAMTDSFVDQCWKPVDIVIPEDGSKEVAAVLLHEKSTRLKEKYYSLSKEVDSFTEFHERVVEKRFCTNDDGRTDVRSTPAWTNLEWDEDIRACMSLDASRPLHPIFRRFKESYVAEAKAQDRPLEACKAEMYEAIVQLRRM